MGSSKGEKGVGGGLVVSINPASSSRRSGVRPLHTVESCGGIVPALVVARGSPPTNAAATTRASSVPARPSHRFVDVRVQLQRPLAERLLDVVHAGGARHSQQLVRVSGRHHQQLAWAAAGAAAGEWRHRRCPARGLPLRSSVLPASRRSAPGERVA